MRVWLELTGTLLALRRYVPLTSDTPCMWLDAQAYDARGAFPAAPGLAASRYGQIGYRGTFSDRSGEISW